MTIKTARVRTPGKETVTSALLGEMQADLGLRSEFLALARDQA